MKNLVYVLVALGIIAILLAIWTPFLWQSIATGLLLFFVAAGIHGNSTKKE